MYLERNESRLEYSHQYLRFTSDLLSDLIRLESPVLMAKQSQFGFVRTIDYTSPCLFQDTFGTLGGHLSIFGDTVV